MPNIFIGICEAALVLLALLFFAPVITGRIVNIGNAAGFSATVLLLCILIFRSPVTELVKRLRESTAGRIAVNAVVAAAAVIVLLAAVISGFMIASLNIKPTEGSTAVVLGCKVRGNSPSLMLKRRLDAAYDFLTNNPESFCVVSGGQGADEEYSEASVMKSYLISKGISEDRIFTEDRSSSTEENLDFSKSVIEENGLNKNIVIITDGYHQLRATLHAKKQGLNYGTYSAQTAFWLLPTYWVREWFGIIDFFVFK